MFLYGQENFVGEASPAASLADSATGEPTPFRIDGQALPAPPPEIAALLRTANVRFISGPAMLDQPPGSADRRRNLAAETMFYFEQNHRASSRWRFVDESASTVRVVMRLRRSDWRVTHWVWFRRRPSLEDFWSDSLVRHELDHVRISADRSAEQRFLRRIRAGSTFEFTLDGREGRSTRDQVDAAVARRIRNAFEDVVTAVQIRYRELDRQTRRGRLPTPDAFPLGVATDAGR